MNDNIFYNHSKSLFLLLRHCDFRAFVESHFWHEETLSLLIWLLFYCGSDFVFQEAWVATLRAKWRTPTLFNWVWHVPYLIVPQPKVLFLQPRLKRLQRLLMETKNQRKRCLDLSKMPFLGAEAPRRQTCFSDYFKEIIIITQKLNHIVLFSSNKSWSPQFSQIIEIFDWMSCATLIGFFLKSQTLESSKEKEERKEEKRPFASSTAPLQRGFQC